MLYYSGEFTSVFYTLSYDVKRLMLIGDPGIVGPLENALYGRVRHA
jgi:hypothetical protein